MSNTDRGVLQDNTTTPDNQNSHTRRSFLRTAAVGTAGGLLLSSDLLESPIAVGTAKAAHDSYRPDYHFTPDSGWMNDPNGLVYYNGTYHLFYQAGENRRRWDHATSTDLHNWTEQGTKIPDTDTVQAFSGGATIDSNDTTGFGTDAMVCMYTGHHDDGTEDQRLAYSTDGGDTLIKYSGNPVVDTNHDDWRDPVPFWYDPAEEWRMVVSRVSRHSYGGRTYPAGIEIWRSTDLKDWSYLDTYESGDAGWECPDLYELPVNNTTETRWVMSMSVEWDHHEYHIGHFDGNSFTADTTDYADDGHDFYGGQTWSNDPNSGSRLATAWMSDWEYAMDMPDHGWTGHQLFPRRIELYDTGDKVETVEKPDGAITEAHSTKLADLGDETISATSDPLEGQGVSGQHLDIDVTVDPRDTDSVTLGLRENALQGTHVAYDTANEELIFDRSDSGNMFPGTDSSFPEIGSVPLSTRSDGTIQLRVLVDSSVVEIYANNGQETLSHQVYPDDTAENVSLTASGGAATLESFVAYSTHSEPSTLNQRLVDGSTYRITNRNSGLSLCVEDASAADGAYIVQNKYIGEAHQQWVARRTDAGAWRFENVNSGKLMELTDASTDQGASIQQWTQNGYDHQKWSLTDLDGGYFHAKNINSNWAFDIDGGSTSTGARAMQWEYWGGDNQKWNFEKLS